MMLKLMQDVNTMSMDKLQADILATRAQYEQSDAILGGTGVGWTPSSLSTCYSRSYRNLIASFVKDIRKRSIGLVLELYVTFGHENFVKGPANLFTQALADLRLDGLLTLIAMTYGRLGNLLVLLRYAEQIQGASREYNAQLETALFRKMKDWKILLLQYLLQQNWSFTGEDKVATGTSECKHALANRSVSDDADRSVGSCPWTEGVRHGGVRTREVICIPGFTSEGIQELSVVCQPSFDDLVPCGEESVESLVNVELFYHAGDLTVLAQRTRAKICDKALRDLDQNQIPMMTT